MNKFTVLENDKVKILVSDNYNYRFNKVNGYFERYGKTKNDDPDFCEFGPEILDIEVTTICGGPTGNNPCPFCYKGNTNKGINMSFDTFKNIFDKMTKDGVLTQIAFGADATLTSNPDLWNMMDYSRANGVIPNVTCANIDDTVADKLASVCGAVAISRYSNKNWCYDSVKKLTDRGMKQINIHSMICQETFKQTLETIEDIKTDKRLKKLNAIVFLSLKQKGRGVKFTPLTQEEFNRLVVLCLKNDIRFGFDSCSSNKFLNAIINIYGKDSNEYKRLEQMTEPCESSCFSSYISTEGHFYPCSFTEDVYNGIDVVKCDDFVKDVWLNKELDVFRNKLLCNKDCNNCRKCPEFDI